MKHLLEDTSGILDSLPEALLGVRDGVIVLANLAARQLLGGEESEIIGARIDGLLTESCLESLERRLRGLTAGSPRAGMLRLRLRRLHDGRRLIADCKVSRLLGEAGGGDEVSLILMKDASSQVRAEEMIARLVELAREIGGLSGARGVLKAADPMFKALGWWGGLLQTTAEGALVTHLIGPAQQDHPVTSLGVKLREIGLVPWSQLPRTREAYETGHPVFLEDVPTKVAGVVGFGNEFLESMRACGFKRGIWVPIRPEGTTSHVLLVVGPDLTEYDYAALQVLAALIGTAVRLQSLQRELVRRERLAAVGEMSGVLAHELRNPLAVIFNAVAGLQKRLSPEDDSDGLLGMIQEEADRMKRVVRDLVDFARPSSPEIRPVELAAVVEAALESLLCEGASGEVPVSLSMPNDLPLVDADPHLLQRALSNMLDNAYHAVSEGGGIHIEGRGAADDLVRLRIRNDGPCISTEEAFKVFQPFYTTRATGTGLGLTVVQRVVEDLRGRVRVDPDERGASFSVWLPMAKDGGRVAAGEKV